MSLPDDNRIGQEIAAAHKAPEPHDVALIIIRGLFENGSIRLPAQAKAIAVGTVATALEVWKSQLLGLTGVVSEVQKWKDAYRDTKMELDDLKLHLAMLRAEGKL
jgi:hypothetical protein